jgi:Uma2 family endonuclease
MSSVLQVITADELIRMTGEVRRELVKGELRTMAPAGFDHGAIIDNLQFRLSQHVRAHKLGVILGAETGFKLAKNPDTVRGADIAFIAARRLPPGSRPMGYWEGAPDLAVEVLSPSDTVEEIEEKVDDYLSAGARLVWVVNPRRKTVTIHRTGADPVIRREQDSLDADDVVPGFVCRVEEIFA